MKRLGLDLGTKHIVLSFRGDDNKVVTRYEVNGYIILPNNDKFTKNLLVQQGVPFVERGSEIIAIGQKAEKLAYSFNKTLCRPMCDGAVSKTDGDAHEIIAIIIRSIIGRLSDDAILYYCTTASAVNSDNLNIEFHKRVVKLIIEGYSGESKINSFHINEARCLILNEPGEVIGISWGAGTVTVHAHNMGVPIFEFSVVGSGDLIDTEVAKQFGYDPNRPDKESSETPTTVCRRKHDIDLGKIPEDRVGKAIYLMYQIVVEEVVRNIVRGLRDNRSKFRFSEPVNIINGGGTSMPRGFLRMLRQYFEEHKGDFNFSVGDVKLADNPLFAVSIGCLHASEMHD